jgi:hypothetical protein
MTHLPTSPDPNPAQPHLARAAAALHAIFVRRQPEYIWLVEFPGRGHTGADGPLVRAATEQRVVGVADERSIRERRPDPASARVGQDDDARRAA